jgi:methyl-accepting chemotaxis protein
MDWLRDRRTMTKLMLVFGVMAVLMIVVGVQGMRGMGAIDQELKDVYEKHSLGLNALRRSQLRLVYVTRTLRTILLDITYGNEKGIDVGLEDFKKRDAEFAEMFGEYRKLIVRAEDQQEAGEVERAFRDLRSHQDKLVALARAGKVKEAYGGLETLRQQALDIETRMQKLGQSKQHLMKAAVDKAQATYQSTVLLLVVVVAGAVVLAVVLGVMISRMIAGPLGRAVEVLQNVAAGDFTRKLDVDTKDEVGQMASALNEAVDGMRGALQEVGVAANHAASASQQLSAASEQLSSGAQEQASSLEETAASLEEITGTVKQNADNARQANQLATGSREVAERGGQVVAHAVQSMSEINKSSKRIADIITTIDEIAFQTNLLALNAAVEAARAGEQGRGFAVVASEVRNLAQRSAMAAKEIKDLIQDSVQKVEAGSELVNKSGETLSEIVGSVKRVTDIVAEIAAASQEQSSGIDQVNKAVTQMDQVTQSNAAQTEELSSTAQSLAAQAQQLLALVARFKLGDTSTRTQRVAYDVPAPAPSAKTPIKRVLTPSAARAKARVEPAFAGAGVGSHHNGTNGSALSKSDGFEEF